MTRAVRLALCALAGCLALGCLAPAQAGAAFGVGSLDVYFSAAEEGGAPATLAGSHPFSMTTNFGLETFVNGAGLEEPQGALKDLEVELPIGLAGIPKAVPQCPGSRFAEIDITTEPQLPNCSDDSAVGYVNAHISFNPVVPGMVGNGGVPLYNLVPAPGTVAKFGFVVASVPVTIEARLSESAPYRVIAAFRNAPQPLLVYGASVTLWGDPASPAHDAIRGSCLNGIAGDGSFESNGSCPVSPGTPEVAYLTMPRACQGPLAVPFAADPWGAPGAWARGAAITHDAAGAPQGVEGCGEQGFDPTVSTAVSTGSAESPAGLEFGVGVDDPGVASPSLRADSDIKQIVTRLSEGMTLNPAAAEGLAGCTTAQLEAESLDSAPGAGCPGAAKIGSVTATSPLVDEPLTGSIFVATPYDNPSHSFLGVYLVLRNQKLGVIVRQAGRVEADPTSGRLTASFEELPQLPISRIEASFREGPRAPLASPGRCGTYVAEADQTPWARPAEELPTTAEFKIASGPGGGSCAGVGAPFSPRFRAGTDDNQAGSYSPLSLELNRADGEAELTALSTSLPAGLSGRLAGIPYCSDAAIAAARSMSGTEELAHSSCPADSQIGRVEAGAGVGPDRTWVAGKVYLAGPFERDPLSIVVVTPAVAGPFDVGDVVIREALAVDPFTAQVSIEAPASESIPRILKGIPLRLRDLRIYIDRPGFTLNPTSCEPSSIGADILGTGPLDVSSAQAGAAPSVRYQASGCSALGFRPKLTISLKGSTRRAGHPALRAVVTYPKGGAYANIARAQVNLPHSEFIDQANLNKTCTRPVLLEGKCPKKSIYGRAKAWTPLLEKPLEGPVYLVGGFGYKLPALVAELNGEIRVLLVGKVDSGKNRGIRNTFEAVPDAPVSRFELRMKGGPRYSLLENSEDICRRPQHAGARFIAQNGRALQLRPRIAVGCTAKKSSKSHHRDREGKR